MKHLAQVAGLVSDGAKIWTFLPPPCLYHQLFPFCCLQAQPSLCGRRSKAAPPTWTVTRLDQGLCIHCQRLEGEKFLSGGAAWKERKAITFLLLTNEG